MDEQQNQTVPTQGGNNKLVIVGIIVALVAFAGLGVFAYSQTKTPNASPTKIVEENTNQDSGRVTSATEYKNGVFTAEGEYLSPGGPERVKVTVTINEDTVSEVEVVSLAKHPTSKIKQADFIANYKPMVVGKNINEIELTKVSGSSLTPKGFNNALDQIKSQASS